MGDSDIHLILQISKFSAMVGNELHHQNAPQAQVQLTDSLFSLLSFISQWADLQEEKFLKHHSLKLAQQAIIKRVDGGEGS